MDQSTLKYPSLSNVMHDLTMFMKLQQNNPLTLADFTKIAEGRWDYFRNNWDFIKKNYLTRIAALPNGDVKTNATAQFNLFTELVISNRVSPQNPLSNPSNLRKFKDLLDQIRIDDLQITLAEQVIINNEVNRITTLRKDDFFQMRERVRITHDKVTDGMGLGDANYDSLYERVPSPQIVTFRFSDFQVLSSLIELKDTITSMIPTKFVSDERPDPFLQIRQSLKNPAIPMQSSTTGFMIPFPAGSTLERLAAQQLGSADRWLELATANGLQYPYVDEVGQRLPLLITGTGNTIIIALQGSPKFAPGDEVFVGSDALALSRRDIISLTEDKNNNEIVIVLSGAADLDRYLTLQHAFLFFYARNTINSSKFIMIPTPGGAVGFPINVEDPWFVKNLSQDLRKLGVDLALSSDTDLVFDSTGDLQLIYGLANAAQAANLKVTIKTKELIRNPNFGLQEIAGKYRNNEITQSLVLLLIETAMGGDDRFDGTDGLSYQITDTALFISTSIRLAGSDSSIPLTFQIPKGN